MYVSLFLFLSLSLSLSHFTRGPNLPYSNLSQSLHIIANIVAKSADGGSLKVAYNGEVDAMDDGAILAFRLFTYIDGLQLYSENRLIADTLQAEWQTFLGASERGKFKKLREIQIQICSPAAGGSLRHRQVDRAASTARHGPGCGESRLRQGTNLRCLASAKNRNSCRCPSPSTERPTRRRSCATRSRRSCSPARSSCSTRSWYGRGTVDGGTVAMGTYRNLLQLRLFRVHALIIDMLKPMGDKKVAKYAIKVRGTVDREGYGRWGTVVSLILL